jgi:glycosyltransferase involved in cell wall biosynthesis
MRILHLITELELGGAERLLATTLPRLDRKRFEVSVAYLYGNAPLRVELERAGIRVTKLDSRRKLDFAAFARLGRLLRDERIEILHTHLIQADLLGFFAARRVRVPIVVSTKHNTHYFQSHGGWLERLDAFANRRLNRIVAVSEAVKRFYMETQRLDAAAIEVIHNGIELEQFRSSPPLEKFTLGLRETDKLVCAVGSLTEKKGHALLLHAWPEIVRAQPNARLALVGDGPLRGELERLTDSLGIRATVQFLGRRRDVPSILRAADVFALPSLWEGFGIVVVEAMAASVPVVASSVDGVCEIVRDGVDGLLVPPKDSKRLGEAIVRVLNEPALAKQLTAAAQEHAEQFSIQNTVGRLEALYESLMASKR